MADSEQQQRNDQEEAHADADGSASKDEAELELEHFCRVCHAFSFYGRHALARVTRALAAFHRLPDQHKALLSNFTIDMRKLQEAITCNDAFIQQIVGGIDFLDTDTAVPHIQDEVPSEFFMDKVYTTLKQFHRDWASEGQAERSVCYEPLLDAVERLFAQRNPNEVSILTPGAGLGRLTWEFAKRGYTSQGNEWSAFMLFASNFILNKLNTPHSITIHPFAHLYSNVTSRQHQLREVRIPDVDPRALPEGTQFSMAAGDFFQIYDEPDAWDCIASCYALDTARNPIAFLERAFRILKPGGYLLNFGPLLYHYEDSHDVSSLELPLDDVLMAARGIGFTFIEERRGLRSTYNDDPTSMLHTVFDCAFFIAQKPTVTDAAGAERDVHKPTTAE